MIKLKENEGIPRNILLMMSIVSGLTVANLYYNQPLLEEMRASLRINEVEANFITVITQIGYALGLLLIVPMADKCSRRKIVTTCMTIAMLMALVIALASNVWLVWGASIIIGACSVVPQIFVPMAGLFSRPEHKSRNMGFVLSGLLTGVLAARRVTVRDKTRGFAFEAVLDLTDSEVQVVLCGGQLRYLKQQLAKEITEN